MHPLSQQAGFYWSPPASVCALAHQFREPIGGLSLSNRDTERLTMDAKRREHRLARLPETFTVAQACKMLNISHALAVKFCKKAVKCEEIEVEKEVRLISGRFNWTCSTFRRLVDVPKASIHLLKE